MIDCSELNCKSCPSDICEECFSGYYLYENKSCISQCEGIDG